jgi:ribosomal protein S18 acetylase RimI-like enzyme
MLSMRILTPEDWRAWRELRLLALQEAPYAFSSTIEEWQGAGDSEQRWRARWKSVAFNVLAYLDDQPAGIAGATEPDSFNQVELRSMWVAPWARGCGVGDELVGVVLKWAEERRSNSVTLQVFQDNWRATALYGRQGFKNARAAETAGEEHRRKNFMVRPINPAGANS